MGFALDHADASADVVGVLKESLLVPETPIHGELAEPGVLESCGDVMSMVKLWRAFRRAGRCRPFVSGPCVLASVLRCFVLVPHVEGGLAHG